jgi:hypothetical protein
VRPFGFIAGGSGRFWSVLVVTVGDFVGATALFLSGAPSHSSLALGCLIVLAMLVWVGAFLLIRINKHISYAQDLTTPVR